MNRLWWIDIGERAVDKKHVFQEFLASLHFFNSLNNPEKNFN